jgi:hypothetical protein
VRIEVSSGCFEAGFPQRMGCGSVCDTHPPVLTAVEGIGPRPALTALQKEEHPRARVLRQPSGQDTARSTAAHNVSSL